MTFRLAIIVSSIFLLAGCQTESGPASLVTTVDAAAANGEVRSPGLLLYDNETVRNCTGCGNVSGPTHVRFRFNGDNLVYQIAYAPLNNEKFDPDGFYRIDIPIYLKGSWRIPLTLNAIDFKNATKTIGSDGRTYWVSEWFWNSILYRDLVAQNMNYSYEWQKSKVKNHLTLLKTFRNMIHRGKTVDHWNMTFSIATKRTAKHTAPKVLRGDIAIAALEDPESAYATHVAAFDAAAEEERQKKLRASKSNRAYSVFVARNLTPLTAAGRVRKAKCPDLPYQLRVNYNPPEDFYTGAERAMARAECLRHALESYAPDALTDAYERLLDEETRLFEATYKVERFSLKDSLSQPNAVLRDADVALRRAQYLFEGGDTTARMWKRQRARQRQETAMMQSLMSGLQSVERSLQSRNAATQQRIARLQREAALNARRKRLEHKRQGMDQATATGTTATQEASAPKPAAPKGPMIAVYQASSHIVSLPDDPNCANGLFDAKRAAEITCTGVKVITMPSLFTRTAGELDGCSGNPEVDTVDAFEASIIGGIYRLESVTRGELERLRTLGKQRTNKSQGMYFEQDAARAQSALETWKYEYSLARNSYRHFRNMTELRNYVRSHDCTAIDWERPDGSRYVERLDRVR